MTYDPNKRLAPRTAKTLDEIKEMLFHEGFARVRKADKGSLKAAAGRRGYKWSWTRDGSYYIVKVVVK